MKWVQSQEQADAWTEVAKCLIKESAANLGSRKANLTTYRARLEVAALVLDEVREWYEERCHGLPDIPF
jgi:hypothetical protein